MGQDETKNRSSFFSKMSDKVYRKIDEKISDKNYDDIFGEESSFSENVSSNNYVELLTWDDITNFYFETNKMKSEIRSCIIFIEDIARMNGEAKYRMEQLFKNSEGELVMEDKIRKLAYGRIIFAADMDQKLKCQLDGKMELFFEI